MKAILQFDFDNDGDEQQHFQCLKGPDALLALNDLATALREVVKYSDNETDRKYAEHWQSMLLTTLDHRGINLDDIW